jgi:hypothetical protein
MDPLPPLPPVDATLPLIEVPIEVATELATDAATAPATNDDTVVCIANVIVLTFVASRCGGGVVVRKAEETGVVFAGSGVLEMLCLRGGGVVVAAAAVAVVDLLGRRLRGLEALHSRTELDPASDPPIGHAVHALAPAVHCTSRTSHAGHCPVAAPT